MITLVNLVQKISAATVEGSSPKLAKSLEVQEIQKVSCDSDSNVVTVVNLAMT